jgi:hypothetical protein
MNSLKKQSRIAALLYFINGLPAPFALLYVPSVLIVPGDAAATANNVRNGEGLLRAGMVCCMLVGYVIYKSTFLPRILGVLEMAAGVGYATYLWPPLANYLYPYNLALGVGELALGSGSSFSA